MARHFTAVAIIWAILTAIGWGLTTLDLFPTVGSPEAEDFDYIFKFLMYVGMPVLTLVFAVLIYGMFTWRHQGGAPEEAGATFYGNGWIPRVWLVITGGLAAFVMIHPGLTGLAKLQDDKDGYGWGATTEINVIFRVTAQRFAFGFDVFEGACPESTQDAILASYAPGGALPVEVNGCTLLGVIFPAPAGEFNLIKLPVDQRSKFEIHSVDVLHSFWIPAFRLKADAIPGRTTFWTAEPDVLGSYDTDAAYRVQCAELCGVNHTIMRTRVEVVEAEEFDAWIESLQGAGN